MSYSFLETRRGRFAAVLIALCATIVAACSGPSPVNPSLRESSDLIAPDRSTPNPSPTPYQWTFTTINDPANSTYNCNMGIDELNQIDGTYGTGSKTDPSHGFTATYPYTKFKTLDYPGAINSVATSMSSNKLFAGYELDDKIDHNTWGWIRNKGIWTQYKDLKTPKGAGSINELLGVNDSGIEVGFYMNSSGDDVPFVLADSNYRTLAPPGYVSATANGINLTGVITGTETLSNGTTEGWLLDSQQNYIQFAYPGSQSTTANALNFQQQIVGWYVDAQGATHGYILTRPASHSQQYWQSVDEPNAVGWTRIYSTNSKHSISGCYVDSNGNTQGFVGILQGSNDAKRR